MNKNTEKAVKQIPHEIRKLTKVVATIGGTIIDTRIGQIKAGRETIKTVVPKGKHAHRGKKQAGSA